MRSNRRFDFYVFCSTSRHEELFLNLFFRRESESGHSVLRLLIFFLVSFFDLVSLFFSRENSWTAGTRNVPVCVYPHLKLFIFVIPSWLSREK